MRGNCIGDGDGGLQSLVIKLNNVQKNPDTKNTVTFSATEIRDSHNHDNKYLGLGGGTITGQLNINRNTAGSYGSYMYPIVQGQCASNDYVGIAHSSTGSDGGRLVLFTGDNGNEPIICTQTTNLGALGSRVITLMDSSGNSSFYSVTANGSINTTNRYYQQGTVGSIVCFSTGCGNGNMGWAW